MIGKNLSRGFGVVLAGVMTVLPVCNVCNVVATGTITATYPYYGFVEDADNPWETVYDALDETGTIEYSDDYFDEASAGDHPELRAVSYALALGV